MGEAPAKVERARPVAKEEPVVKAVEPDHEEEPHENAINDNGQRMAVAIVLTEEASTVRALPSHLLSISVLIPVIHIDDCAGM